MKIELLVFGGALVLLGALLIPWHVRVWYGYRRGGTLKEREFRHYRRQYLRRMQLSLFLILLGVAIPVGDALWTAGQLSPLAKIVWIAGLLVVALWILLLAVVDWIIMRIHTRTAKAALATLARRRRDLESEVARLRQHRGNGQG